MINEYDSMKYFLNKIRKPNLNEGLMGQQQPSPESGEKVNFNDIKTVGFLKNNTGAPFTDQYRNQVIMAIGEFLKESGLILSVVNIELYNGRIVISSNTVNNPGVDFVKNILIDTKEDNPKFELVSGDTNINSDYMNLIGNLTRTYNDPKIGRDNLAQVAQVNL
jgi:hypothetical protein